MVTDSSAESRKVDKKTAQALWESAVLPSGTRKKRGDDNGEAAGGSDGNEQMSFTVITKRGNKQLVCTPIPPTHSSAYSCGRPDNLQFLLRLLSRSIRAPRSFRTRSNSST